LDGTTKFTYDVTDKSDSDYTVSDFCIYATEVSAALSGTDAANPGTKALGCKA
jgi:hypothetical protein